MAERGFERRAPDRLERRAHLGRRRRGPVVAVPGLHRRGRREQPGLRRRDLLARLDHLAATPASTARLAGEALPSQQDRHGRLDADEARQPLRAARARQQADQRFRQADRGVLVVGQHAVVRGQREFAAAAERQSRDRGGDRLAAGLQRAQARGSGGRNDRRPRESGAASASP